MTRLHMVRGLALSAVAAGAVIVANGATNAGVYAGMARDAASHVTAGPAGGGAVEAAQYRRGYAGPRGGYAPRAYYGPRGMAPRAYGGRAWAYRPWYRRPYYGTIIGGIALGTIIAATAYGLAPRPPRPDLCWDWADEVQSRGYWDYC